MPQRVITLTTDFGTTDHFVGVMKGVILGIAPRASIVDITHEIAPFNVRAAAFVVHETWRYFPKGTIHVVVIDPGVGSARRPLLVEAGGQLFVGPDNGVFSMLYDGDALRVRTITNPKLMRKQISKTFHGRDVFAPVAAHLAGGVKPAQAGNLIHDYVGLDQMKPVRSGKTWRGVILKDDRFGNLITNFKAEDFGGNSFEARIGGKCIHRMAQTYAETEVGELFAIVGSSGYLEIAANQTSAAALLGCSAGANIEWEILG